MASFNVQYIFTLVDRFTGKAKPMARAADNVRNSARQMGSALTGADAAVRRVGASADVATTKLTRMATVMRSMRTVHRGFGGVGGLGTSAGGGIFGMLTGRVLFDFDKAMNAVQALSDRSAERMKPLRDLALELGETTRYTATQVAEGMTELARAGLGRADGLMEGMMGPVVNLAAAADVTMKQAADIVTNIAKTFGQDVKELPRVVDILAQAVTNTNADLNQIAQSVKYAGPVAQRYGVSLEETTGVIMALAQIGLKADQAGTGLARVLNYLQDIGPKDVKALASIGMSQEQFFKSDGNSVGLRNIIAMFKQAEETYGKLKVNEVLNRVFAQRGGRILMGALERPMSEIDEFIELLKNAEGRSERMRQIYMQGLPGAIWELAAAFESLIIKIGDKGGVTATIVSIAESIRSMTKAMSSMSPTTLGIIGHLALFATAISAVALPLGIFAFALGALAPAAAAAAGAFSMLAKMAALPFFATIGATAGYMTRLTAAFLQFGPAVTGVAAALARAVTGFTAIGVAVYALISYWDQIKQFFAGLGDGFAKFYKGSEIEVAVNAMASALEAVVSAFTSITGITFDTSGITSWFDAGAEAARRLLNPIQSIMDALGWIGQKLGFGGGSAITLPQITPDTVKKMTPGSAQPAGSASGVAETRVKLDQHHTHSSTVDVNVSSDIPTRIELFGTIAGGNVLLNGSIPTGGAQTARARGQATTDSNSTTAP